MVEEVYQTCLLTNNRFQFSILENEILSVGNICCIHWEMLALAQHKYPLSRIVCSEQI